MLQLIWCTGELLQVSVIWARHRYTLRSLSAWGLNKMSSATTMSAVIGKRADQVLFRGGVGLGFNSCYVQLLSHRCVTFRNCPRTLDAFRMQYAICPRPTCHRPSAHGRTAASMLETFCAAGRRDTPTTGLPSPCRPSLHAQCSQRVQAIQAAGTRRAGPARCWR